MNIMIRATNWVGDAITALPALRAVRRRYLDAQISIVARPYVADIYRDQQVCDLLIPYDPKGEHRGWRGRKAVKWTIAGSTALLIAYVGSKVLLELVLKQ